MRRAALLLPILLLAPAARAARVTVGTATGTAGGTAAVPISFSSEGSSVAILQVDLTFAAPLGYSSVATSPAATAAGKQASAAVISGGVRLLVYGLNQTLIPDGVIATVTFTVAAGTGSGSYPVAAGNGQAADPNGNVVALSATSGAVTVGGTQPAAATWILPSSAHSSGANGAFYTTDLAVANTGTLDGLFTLKFLGHDADGRSGTETTLAIGAGRTTVVGDVLGSLFSVTSGYGAIQISSTVTTLAISGQTSTPPPPSCGGGTFGQSVPAIGASQLASSAAPRSLVGVREDAAFRTNLILANAGQGGCDAVVTLVLGNGTTAASKSYNLQPLGMTQVTRVVRDLGYGPDLSGARLVVSTANCVPGIAAYASLIDNATNDPRTLLPQ